MKIHSNITLQYDNIYVHLRLRTPDVTSLYINLVNYKEKVKRKSGVSRVKVVQNGEHSGLSHRGTLYFLYTFPTTADRVTAIPIV